MDSSHGSAHIEPVRDRESSRRWYESSRIIWGLFGILGVLLTSFGLSVFAMASANRDKTGEHAAHILKVETEVKAHRELLENKLLGVEREMQSLDVRQQRMEGKIDQVIQRLK